MVSRADLGRKLVTLYGECGIVKDDPLVEPSTLERGYALMNEEVVRFAQRVTVHSVSYAPLVFSEPGGYRVWLYASVVYSGDVDLMNFFGSEEKDAGEFNRGNARTVFQAFL